LSADRDRQFAATARLRRRQRGDACGRSAWRGCAGAEAGHQRARDEAKVTPEVVDADRLGQATIIAAIRDVTPFRIAAA
jgi:hypothetical protein